MQPCQSLPTGHEEGINLIPLQTLEIVIFVDTFSVLSAI